MPEVFFISKMNKIENHNLSNEHQNENFQISWIFLQFLLDFAQKFPLYTKWAKIKPIPETSTLNTWIGNLQVKSTFLLFYPK